MSSLSLSSLAVPGVLLLVFFLAFSSQVLLQYIEPGPLESNETLLFNGLVTCLLICYYRACATDPGRIPAEWEAELDVKRKSGDDSGKARHKSCRKCGIPKPPRAHHCKTCQRCILKMDHHCPWTTNCVSHITLPHFIRFVFYAVAAMSYLEYFLYIRAAVLWDNRNLPSYLGPTAPQLAHLFLLIVANSLTLFALLILVARTLWNLGANTTTIEGWEIERHEALMRRARHMGGYLDGPDGIRIKIVRQEFPYDIGIWKNISQGMGSGNPIAWFWPLSASPSVESGLHFETNGFEDASVTWPPPDPDRIPRQIRPVDGSQPFTYSGSDTSNQDMIDAFRRRQEEDMKRWTGDGSEIKRRQPFRKRYEAGSIEAYDEGESEADEDDGEEGWRNSEGERLADFGVDEMAEFYDGADDDVPLGQLLQRRMAERDHHKEL